MVRKNNFKSAGAIVLGMHDALVSLTGLIAGLAVAMADRYYIILTAIIASVTASLSMGASNYLSVRAGGGKHAFINALYTGGAYMATCILLIIPFFIFENRATELVMMFAIAITEIFLFNYFLGHAHTCAHFWKCWGYVQAYQLLHFLSDYVRIYVWG